MTVLDDGRKYIYLFEATPYNPALTPAGIIVAATRTVRFLGLDVPPYPSERHYRAWLRQPLTMKRSLFGRDLMGGVSPSAVGAVIFTVDSTYATLRAFHKTLAYRMWPVVVSRGAVGAVRSAYQPVFTGVFSGEPTFKKTQVSFPVSDLLIRLDRPFALSSYAGTGGFEGGADLKDKRRPKGVGYVYGAEGVWVDETNGWVDYNEDGFHSVSKVTDGGTVLVEDVSNPPASGKYYVDYGNGRIRYSLPPTYRYRVDFRSTFSGSDGGFLGASETIGDIMYGAVEWSGIDPDQIDDAAFTALATARPEKVGWYAREGQSIKEMAEFLVGKSLCYLTVDPSNDGKVTIGELRPPTATAKTDAQVALVVTDDLIVKDSFSRTVKPPPSRIEFRGRKNWCVLSDTEIAAGALQGDKDFARAEWRTIAKENSDTDDAWQGQAPKVMDTPFVDLTELDAWADEVAAFLTEPQPEGEVTLAIPPFTVPLGAELWFDSAVNETSGPAIFAEADENTQQNIVKVRYWALQD